MITVNAMGDPCPIPVVKTKKAIQELSGAGAVEVLVDNEIAVQNLTKMAVQKGYGVRSEKLAQQQYRVIFEIGAKDSNSASAQSADQSSPAGSSAGTQQTGAAKAGIQQADASSDCPECHPDRRRNVVVVISSDRMGLGNDELGGVLMKGFLYALAQQDELPSTVLFYNGGVKYTCEESPSLEDLRSLEAQGVEILSCGTCLNYYGLTEKLQVGGVTNMYVIAEKMTQAGLVVKP